MTDAWGIASGYEDAQRTWQPLGGDTRRALLAAMGLDPAAPATPDRDTVLVLRHGERHLAPAAGDLTLEDGRSVAVDTALPSDLPLGYHRFHGDDERVISLIVTPGRCPAPSRNQWGWAAQLYAARSAGSWGIGDLADLRRLCRWAGSLGARVVLVNPLHPAVPREPEDPSPYAPSSRRYRDPIYLRIEDVPGASELGAMLAELQTAGRALNTERRLDRPAVRRLKQDALERCWMRFAGNPDFETYVRQEGRSLLRFATFCALAEHHRAPWRTWPDEHRHPDRPGVVRFADTRRDRVRFHQWIQWVLDRQLAAAGGEVAIVHDFPVGVDADGADAWAWQDLLALGASIGAPPDRYNRNGQDWGLPPFVPHRLRASGYAPFVEALRAGLRHGGGLRIDHVMGFFRLFWVPHGLTPAEGGYVRYPAEELLAILALESHRAGAFIVGEDLGTVEAGVRERLGEAGVLSTRVLWFESAPPEEWPELALATVTTHDLPTLAGFWHGSDLAAQRALGLQPSAEAYAAQRRRVAVLAGVTDDAPVERVVTGVHRALARARSRLVTATLEDALAVDERPNMPGVTTGWPSWSLALPVPLEALEEASLPRAIATALSERGRTGSTLAEPAGSDPEHGSAVAPPRGRRGRRGALDATGGVS